MVDLTEFRSMVNPYSFHDLEGEEAFLEQLAQAVSVLNIALYVENLEEARKASERIEELYWLRTKERKKNVQSRSGRC